LGLVASLGRPGGDMTGVNVLFAELVAKRLGLLHDLVPKAVRVAVLVNPASTSNAEATLREIPEAARGLGLAGGLMSYGTNLLDMYRQVGVYTGQILKGAKPAELPVLQSTKFEFVINLKTARALGIDVPNSLQSIADEVIE
jgi:ABC-type uncharacterized transport system substrate-binding protein